MLVLAGCESDDSSPGLMPGGDAGAGILRDGGSAGQPGGGSGRVPGGGGGACPSVEALACADSVLDSFPVDVSGNNTGATDTIAGASCSRGGDGIPDWVYQWTAPAGGRYVISTEGSSIDTILSVRGSCDGAEIACQDDIARRNLASQVTVTLETCQTVAIVVDGFDNDAMGDFRLRISGTENNCEDGADDDGDGLVDCADSDCVSAEACAPDDDWPAEWASFEVQMVAEVNRYRAMGYRCTDAADDNFPPAGPLEMDNVIRVAARAHSQDMGAQNYFEHDSLDGREFSDRMTNAGFMGPSPWGENIAAGYGTAAEATLGLMNSPGHCRNIMNAEYNVVGIGYAFDAGSDFRHYWTQNFAAGH